MYRDGAGEGGGQSTNFSASHFVLLNISFIILIILTVEKKVLRTQYLCETLSRKLNAFLHRDSVNGEYCTTSITISRNFGLIYEIMKFTRFFSLISESYHIKISKTKSRFFRVKLHVDRNGNEVEYAGGAVFCKILGRFTKF